VHTEGSVQRAGVEAVQDGYPVSAYGTSTGASQRRVTAEGIANALGGTRSGDGWKARCPAHNDANPSLSIHEGTGGKVLVKCHGPCAQEAVIDALNRLGLWGNPGKGSQPPLGKVVASYDYKARDGKHLYYIDKYEPKDFRRRPAGGNQHVLYRWPEIVAAGPDATLFVCEGEKDADRVTALRFVATTVAHGTWKGVDVKDIAGRDVIILEDADKPGVKKALAAAQALRGAAKTIRIVRLPGHEYTAEKHGKDVSDWLDEGHTADAFVDACFAAPLWNGGDEPNDSEPNDGEPLAEMNRDNCVVLEGARVRILRFERHVHVSRGREYSRFVPTFLQASDFKLLHSNRRVQVGRRLVDLGTWWLMHEERRQYAGIVFVPGGAEVVGGKLNLWRGWGIEPKQGDWTRMQDHIFEVLAASDKTAFVYILNWLTWLVQNPGDRAEVALVFKGHRGSGKGTLGNALMRIFGQHAHHVSSATQLVGRFNGHMRDCCYLFADEAYWPGDKAAEGNLKRMITEPTLEVEAKGRDAVTVPNMLHVLMAANEDWVVPAGEMERRPERPAHRSAAETAGREPIAARCLVGPAARNW
jgi:5S rRNA maturation endonuclease (ribonuclease M5)